MQSEETQNLPGDGGDELFGATGPWSAETGWGCEVQQRRVAASQARSQPHAAEGQGAQKKLLIAKDQTNEERHGRR